MATDGKCINAHTGHSPDPSFILSKQSRVQRQSNMRRKRKLKRLLDVLPVRDVMGAKETRINSDSVVWGNLPINWDWPFALL